MENQKSIVNHFLLLSDLRPQNWAESYVYTLQL